MIRATRMFLTVSKEYNNIQGIYISTSSKQFFSENVKTNILAAENNVRKSSNEFSDFKKKIIQNDYNLNSNEEKDEIFSEIENVHDNIREKELKSGIDNKPNLREGNKTLRKSVQTLKYFIDVKTRPVNVLQSVLSNIDKNKNHLNLKNSADLFYCMAKLSLKKSKFLDALAKSILEDKDVISSGVIPANILLSCGILKYRNTALIDMLAEKILSYEDPKKNQQMLTALMTMATVNYLSPNGEKVINILSKYSKTDFKDSLSYLNFVWACVLLQQFPENHISTVLSTEFLTQLEIVNDIYGVDSRFESTRLKILNINAVTSHMPSYKGNKLKNLRHSFVLTKKKSEFLSFVLDGLTHILPKTEFFTVNYDIKAGFIVDVLFYLDNNMNPISIENKQNGIKLGLLLLDYNDFCLDSEEVVGTTAFKKYILKKEGYKIVIVNNNYYKSLTKMSEKVNYLRTCIKIAFDS